ncbi:hypothetical protein OAF34_00885 [Pirellulaceae bacterium]|nr:hypothetical protein [Pirellulaceae bacterium]
MLAPNKQSAAVVLVLSFAASTGLAEDPVIEAARSHIIAILQFDGEKLKNSYAERVELMPGHEFLAARYQLADEKPAGKSLIIAREKLITAMVQAKKRNGPIPAEMVKVFLEKSNFTVLPAEEGDFEIEPSKKSKTIDGKLHFKIRMGDRIIKVGPPNGDFALFQFRKTNKQWKVVSECLD